MNPVSTVNDATNKVQIISSPQELKLHQYSRAIPAIEAKCDIVRLIHFGYKLHSKLIKVTWFLIHHINISCIDSHACFVSVNVAGICRIICVLIDASSLRATHVFAFFERCKLTPTHDTYARSFQFPWLEITRSLADISTAVGYTP